MLILLRVAGIMPGNESELLLPLLMTHAFIDVTLFIAAAILISSMVADIVEDSEKTTGRRSEGTFFAARSFAAKFVSGSGIITAGFIISASGFPKGAAPGTVPTEVLNKLALFFAPSLLFFYLIALYCISYYKISRDSHKDNVAAATSVRGNLQGSDASPKANEKPEDL